MPRGADTIVMQEHAKAGDGSVTIGSGHRKAQHVRRAGEDLARGQIALKAGMPMRPADIGLVASLGIPEVAVYRGSGSIDDASNFACRLADRDDRRRAKHE